MKNGVYLHSTGELWTLSSVKKYISFHSCFSPSGYTAEVYIIRKGKRKSDEVRKISSVKDILRDCKYLGKL